MNGIEPKLPLGFKRRVFGAVLAVFGIVDTAMNLLVGLPPDGFYIFLIAAGTALFLVGAKQK